MLKSYLEIERNISEKDINLLTEYTELMVSAQEKKDYINTIYYATEILKHSYVYAYRSKFFAAVHFYRAGAYQEINYVSQEMREYYYHNAKSDYAFCLAAAKMMGDEEMLETASNGLKLLQQRFANN